jgi:hypothetical protein
MGAGCSTANSVDENGHGAPGQSVLSARSGGGLTPRSMEVVTRSVMAYIPSAVSQFYISKPKEV